MHARARVFMRAVRACARVSVYVRGAAAFGGVEEWRTRWAGESIPMNWCSLSQRHSLAGAPGRGGACGQSAVGAFSVANFGAHAAPMWRRCVGALREFASCSTAHAGLVWSGLVWFGLVGSEFVCLFVCLFGGRGVGE